MNCKAVDKALSNCLQLTAVKSETEAFKSFKATWRKFKTVNLS